MQWLPLVPQELSSETPVNGTESIIVHTYAASMHAANRFGSLMLIRNRPAGGLARQLLCILSIGTVCKAVPPLLKTCKSHKFGKVEGTNHKGLL